jgi:hypothetical protein
MENLFWGDKMKIKYILLACFLLLGSLSATNYTYDYLPVAAGHYYGCLLFQNGSSACWYGLNGNDAGQADNITSNTTFVGIWAGEGTTRLFSNGNVSYFGHNNSGARDVENFTRFAVNVSGCHGTYCITNASGQYACYGRNDTGQLLPKTFPASVAMTGSGEKHVCALLTNGNSSCWGNNSYGQSTNYTNGDAVFMSVGITHTCYLRQNGTGVCYGLNVQTANNWDVPSANTTFNFTGNATKVASGLRQHCWLLTNGNVSCYGFYHPNAAGSQYPVTNYTGGDAIGIAAGGHFAIVLRANGSTLTLHNVTGTLGTYFPDYNGNDLRLRALIGNLSVLAINGTALGNQTNADLYANYSITSLPANASYSFTNWTTQGNCIIWGATSPNTTVELNDNCNVTARYYWNPAPPIIEGGGGGYVQGGYVVQNGTQNPKKLLTANFFDNLNEGLTKTLGLFITWFNGSTFGITNSIWAIVLFVFWGTSWRKGK